MVFQAGTLLVLQVAFAVGAMAQTADEYQVKAAFLYNLAKFVEWPAETFKTAKDPIVICILGRSPITEVLQSTVSGKAVEGRTLVIRPVAGAQPLNSCQIFFVSSSERTRFRSIHAEIKANGVLTVGEEDTFISEGGAVNFKLDDGRVRIQIAVYAATQRNLKISSKLLGLAQIVK